MTEQPTVSVRDLQPIPPLLLLSVPAGLSETSVLRAVVRAVRQTHALLRRSIETSIEAAEKAGQEDQNYWWGRLSAYSDAQDFLVREICEQFDINDQSDACEPPPGNPVCVSAAPHRPRLPASDGVEVADEVLEVLYAKRDHLASLAASFSAEACGWRTTDAEDLYLLNRGMSLAYATACDLIEQTLARLTGLDLEAFTAFLDEHGTTRGTYQ
jgi:hypothetical protein